MKPAPRLLVVALILLASPRISFSDWGNLTGKFVLQGEAPQRLVVNAKAGGGGDEGGPILDETWIVGPKGELKNVAVWIAPFKDETAPEPHPDYQKLTKTPIDFDAQGKTFVPHVQAVWTARPVHLRNRDPMVENFTIEGFQNQFNVLVKPGEARVLEFPFQERIPVRVRSGIHPWMRSYLVIRDSPYVAVSGEDGTFTIKNLPAGKWNFAFWHETGYLANRQVGAQKTDRLGRCKITIESGQATDLGTIVVNANGLKP